MNQPDVELIMMSLLDDLGYTDTALPAEPWADIYPVIIINRMSPGSPDPGLLVDRALVALLVIGETRKSAWDAVRAVSSRILNDGLPYEVENEGRSWLIEPTQQVSGNSLEPDIDPDNRFIQASFWVPVSLRF